MTDGFTAEEFEPDAAENTASDGASDTTAKVDGAATAATPAGNGNTNAGNARGRNAGNTTGGAGGNSAGGNNDWPVLGAAAARAAQRRRDGQDADRAARAVNGNHYRGGDLGRALEFLMQRGKAR